MYKKSLKIPKWWSESINRKTRQHNGQNKKDKRTNNDLQNTIQKTKDGTTWTPLIINTGVNAGAVYGPCNTTGATSRAWTAYPSGTHEFTSVSVVFVLLDLFCVLFCRPLFFFCPLYCLSFLELRLLVTHLLSSNIKYTRIVHVQIPD